MSNTKKTALAALVLMIAVVATPAVIASQNQQKGVVDRIIELRGLGKMVDLSDAQRDEIRAIVHETRRTNEERRAEVRQNLRSAALHLLSEPQDTVTAQQMLIRNAVPLQAMRVTAVEATGRAAQVLTPEQRQIISDWVAARDGEL